MNEVTSFNMDLADSLKCNSLFDEYYKSPHFFNLVQAFRERGIIRIKSIIRSEIPVFQQQEGIDCIIEFTCGGRLLIDEKIKRVYDVSKYTKYYQQYGETFAVEIWSNPMEGGKHDGWGYKEGITIAHAPVDMSQNKFVSNPIFYTINNDFVENITKNRDNFPQRINKSTGGLYNSGYCWVDSKSLLKYSPFKNIRTQTLTDFE